MTKQDKSKVQELTEERIREIIKEEIERWWVSLGKRAMQDVPSEFYYVDIPMRDYESGGTHAPEVPG